MKVNWTSAAQKDRTEIWDYIASDNHRAAAQLDSLFSAAAAGLATHPKLGRSGKVSGTRELLPNANYRLVYEIAGETVWILTLIHTARRWPPLHESSGVKKKR